MDGFKSEGWTGSNRNRGRLQVGTHGRIASVSARGFFRYKCDHAGLAFAEVNEAYTTQTCSCCKALTGPKGEEELTVRRWVCRDCGGEHDRDQNAAINIARLGCEALGLQWPGSPSH
jgi:putative transposase